MFYASPSLASARVLILYKNFQANRADCCHVGLGVNAMHTVKVLRKAGVVADIAGVWKVPDISAALARYPGCTHCFIQAPWVKIADLIGVTRLHPGVHFVVRVHSQVAFLQADIGGIQNLRDYLTAQDSELNLTLSCNNTRITEFLEFAYAQGVLYLPNLYDLTKADAPTWRPPGVKDSLRIASFGALRPMKNHLTSAAAALMLAKALGAKLQFFLSTEREPGGGPVVNAVKALFGGLNWVTLVENPWQDWATFRQTIATMDLCIQLSMSESFNITTADAATAYIPSVVSDAIEWAPNSWHAAIDDPQAAANVGLWLMSNQYAGRDGRRALQAYNDAGTQLWLDYLGSNPT